MKKTLEAKWKRGQIDFLQNKSVPFFLVPFFLWQRNNPCIWQLKHVRWFLTQHLKDHSDATRYYYQLTALLIWERLGNDRQLLMDISMRLG
ncbi:MULTISPECIES: hypothetical protein [unclassified Pseudomonas]|uniref:hypothetical protein n=1 Tax=unclassified Pseudomonas TaxID=196821 RepID=UPI0021147928|nr:MULTISPECIES: hypothetical protein [unclassified Pseudomonas]